MVQIMCPIKHFHYCKVTYFNIPTCYCSYVFNRTCYFRCHVYSNYVVEIVLFYHLCNIEKVDFSKIAITIWILSFIQTPKGVTSLLKRNKLKYILQRQCKHSRYIMRQKITSWKDRYNTLVTFACDLYHDYVRMLSMKDIFWILSK